MGFNFRRSVKILPGVRLNISKSGFSTSLSTKGATVNLKSGHKTRVTVGLPGTGISYRENIVSTQPEPSQQDAGQAATPKSSGIGIVGWVIVALGVGVLLGVFIR